MKKNRIREVMIDSGYPAPDLAKRAQLLAESLINECISIIEDAVDHRKPASTYADLIRTRFFTEHEELLNNDTTEERPRV